MFEFIKKPWRINSSRKYLAEFARRAAASIPIGACVLDAGAGDAPYRSTFAQANYDSTDLCEIEKNYGRLSYICDLKNLPIRADHYDLVFCSQTLEHVPDPQGVLTEFERVLKPGGHLWLTAPFYYEEHEVPYDFYRYTQFGLSHLVQNAGLQLESIEWLEGYFGTLAYQLQEAAKAMPLSLKEYGCGFWGWLFILPFTCFKLIFAMLSLFFTWLDLRIKFISRGHSKNYALIAVKVAGKES
jgi:SAM-dependent methyltransferase